MRLPIALDYRPALLTRSGIGRATRELARGLAARADCGLHLFGHSLARARVPAAIPIGATLHRAPWPGRALPALARLGLGADRLAGAPRVFHWTDYVHAPLSRARAVLTVHDLAFVREPRWHGANAAVLRERTATAVAAAAAVIVPSHATAADLRTFAPALRSVHVVPFGADHVPASPPPPQRLGRYLLTVGTIEPRKNLRPLLAALPLLDDAPLLVVVGHAGWECDEIVAELLAAQRAGRALWRRDADDDELWSLLAHAQALVFPSLWEGFGFPPLEAMALGVPVVAHDNAPMHELGDDAFVFADATDPRALAAAIGRVLHDRRVRADAVTAGRHRAADFVWDRCAAAHAAIYHEVAAC
jgi:glycosyltransferase involved in cell wall biosynthesis